MANDTKSAPTDGVDVHTFFGNVAGVAGNTFSDSRFDEGFRLEAIQAFKIVHAQPLQVLATYAMPPVEVLAGFTV